TGLSVFSYMYEGTNDPRFWPRNLHRRMVQAGHYGRKSGQGFYTYNDD
ncbi:MAG TPA: 3-hydroxyacyl-CoA dehydrogenase family protein, partial [Bacillota bacterium]|nr:3-hydroxyacyl-CoA dehydrogenase family protein [Bacillota bacterium]